MQNSTKFKTGSGTMDFRARVGVNYGGFHQTGTSKMVQRRWLGIGSKMADDMTKVIAKNLFKGTYKYTTS